MNKNKLNLVKKIIELSEVIKQAKDTEIKELAHEALNNLIEDVRK